MTLEHIGKLDRWAHEACSRERMALDREDGNPARLELRKEGKELANEKVFAFVKKMLSLRASIQNRLRHRARAWWRVEFTKH